MNFKVLSALSELQKPPEPPAQPEAKDADSNSDIEFVIVRDEFPDSEPEIQTAVGQGQKSGKSLPSAVMSSDFSDDSDADSVGSCLSKFPLHSGLYIS